MTFAPGMASNVDRDDSPADPGDPPPQTKGAETIDNLTRLDRYVTLLVALAWAANVIALVVLWDKGTSRALHKSMITVAGSSLVLLYYWLVALQPGLRGATMMKILRAVGWITMIAGFFYFWISPILINFRNRE